MDWIPDGVRRAFRLDRLSPHQVELDLDAELQFHLAMREAELRAEGMGVEEARAEARRRFGDVEEARRYCRELDDGGARVHRRREWARGWGQDVRFAVRQLRRAPTMALVAVLTLALGIGATTAIFSVVHRLMLAPLPYPDADRIVAVSRTAAKGQMFVTATPALVDAWRDGSNSFEQLGAYRTADMKATAPDGDGDPETLLGVRLSAQMPAVLGVRPTLGRFFLPEETVAGSAPVAMVSYGYWQRRYGGDSDVLGQVISLDGSDHTVIGVLPRTFVLPSFTPISDRQVAVPLVPDTLSRSVFAVGRLRAGVTPETATEQLDAVMTRLAETEPAYRSMTARVMHQSDFLGKGTRNTLLVLLAAVGVVLLIACANVAGLLLARAAGRQRELAVRAALGAGRRRLVRQLLTESALLGTAGGAAGLAVAWAGLRAVIALRPPSLDELAGVRLEPSVLLGSLAVAVATSLIFGLAPALLAAADGLAASLVGSSRSATGRRGAQRLRAALVGGEVALSVVLLVCAGLLVRSVQALQDVDVGVDTRGLAGASVALPMARYPDDGSRRTAYAQLVERVRAIPGVVGVTMAMDMPPDIGVSFGKLEIDGMPTLPGEPPSLIGLDMVSPDYFEMIGTRLLAGHVPTDTVVYGVVINETFARRYWSDGRAVGARLRLSDKAPWQTVTGVVSDIRLPGATGSQHELRMYSYFGGTFEGGAVVVRTAGETPLLLADLTRAAAAVDPGITVRDMRTADGILAQRLAAPRFTMTLLGVFAVVALVLAVVGLYGVVSLAVTQRTREIGVRLALGASPRGVTRMVVGQAMLLAGGGLVVGLGAAMGAVRFVRGMLFGVEPLDAPTFIAVAAALAAVAFVAALIPARRAARVDAMVALRAE
ncbi:MAG: ADOP family duplicated permease [Gemmatimonadaceae bacterium]